jgi:hypothetical protein
MVKNDSFQPIGKRLDNLNKKLKTDHPEDMWVMKDILNAFLLIIESSSSLEQQHIVSKELNRLFDTYEFRYNTILENKKIMTQETLRMQMLAGVITEGEYKAIINKEIEDAEKASLNESMIGGIVGIGAINQIPPRAKADYETAFEHFLGGKYGLNEVEIEEEKIEEGAFGDLLSRMENNTRMAADILTVITLAKEDKEGNAEKAVELLMKNHDLSEEAALEAVTRIFKKAFEWVDSMEEGKEVEEPTNY